MPAEQIETDSVSNRSAGAAAQEAQLKELLLPLAEQAADGKIHAALMWQVMTLEMLVSKGVIADADVQQLLARYDTYASLMAKVSQDLGKDLGQTALRLRRSLTRDS